MTEIPVGPEQHSQEKKDRSLELIGYLGDLGYAVSEIPKGLDLDDLAREVDAKLAELEVTEDDEKRALKDTFLVLAVEGERLNKDKKTYKEKAEGAEFNHRVARLLVEYEESPEVLDKFWKEAENFFPKSERGRFEALLLGIAGEAAVQNYFKHLEGISAVLTDTELDMRGADLLLVNETEQSIAPVQIKTGSEATFRGLGLESGIFSSASLLDSMKSASAAAGLKILAALQINLPNRVGALNLVDPRHGVLTPDGKKFMDHMLGTAPAKDALKRLGVPSVS